MTSDILLMTVAPLLGLGMVTGAALRGWQGWLDLKRRELDQRSAEFGPGLAGGTGRIELADLKERIRKLEAIAAGVDL